MKIGDKKFDIDWQDWWTDVKRWAESYGADPNILYAVADGEIRQLTNNEIREILPENVSDEVIDLHRRVLKFRMDSDNAITVLHGAKIAPIDGVNQVFLGKADESSFSKQNSND